MTLFNAYGLANLGNTIQHAGGKSFVKETGYYTEDAPGYNPTEDALRGYTLLTKAEVCDDQWTIVEEWKMLDVDPSL